jgi:hypothetical protein
MDTRTRLVLYRFVHSHSFHFPLLPLFLYYSLSYSYFLSYSPSLVFSFYHLSYTLP